MTQKISCVLLIVVLAAPFLLLPPGLSAEKVQDPDTKAYQAAYNFILEQKWEAANSALEDFLWKNPKSSWVDDARYWQCFAKEKLEKSLENAFLCYQDFLKIHPGSKYASDAKSNLIRIVHSC